MTVKFVSEMQTPKPMPFFILFFMFVTVLSSRAAPGFCYAKDDQKTTTKNKQQQQQQQQHGKIKYQLQRSP